MKPSSPWPLLLVLVTWPMLAGCPRNQPGKGQAEADGAPKVYIQKVNVVITADRKLEKPGLDRSQVLQRLRLKLEGASGVVLLSEPRPKGQAVRPAYELVLELALARSAQETGLEGPVAVVAALARIPGNLDAPQLHAQAVGALGQNLSQPRVKATLLRLLDSVLDDLVFQAGLSVANKERLVAALSKTRDTQKLAAAVDIVAVRRVSGAVPSLIKLLSHEKSSVVDRAVGALIAIGDRRAVKPLTRLSKFQDTARLAKLLDGIASLGGDDATSYLKFVASGHDDEDIRFMATEALERMKRASSNKGN